MNRWTIGTVGLAVVAAVASMNLLQSQQTYGVPVNWQPSQPVAASSSTHGMLLSSTTLPDATQQIVLIDANMKTMAVYHIQAGTGVIALRSERRIDGDFQMDEFNSTDPTPEKIRAILPR